MKYQKYSISELLAMIDDNKINLRDKVLPRSVRADLIENKDTYTHRLSDCMFFAPNWGDYEQLGALLEIVEDAENCSVWESFDIAPRFMRGDESEPVFVGDTRDSFSDMRSDAEMWYAGEYTLEELERDAGLIGAELFGNDEFSADDDSSGER